MKTLLVTSPHRGAGKTGVLAALALRLAYEGHRVLALRLGAAGDAGAEADAAFYAELPFARGRGGAPVSIADARAAAESGGRPVDLLLLEDAGDGSGQTLAADPDVRVLAVGWGDPASMDEAFTVAREQLGERFAGGVVTAAPARRKRGSAPPSENGSLPPLAIIPEDRSLYAPSIDDVAEALDAEIILGEPEPDQVIEHMLIGPLTADPSDPYFKRRRNKAVITRSDKTDLQLAALHTQTDVLILTGGFPPSPYTIDRAAGEEVPILLTRATTREAVARLSDVWGRSRFRGERKLERMSELLGEQWDLETMTAVAGVGQPEKS